MELHVSVCASYAYNAAELFIALQMTSSTYRAYCLIISTPSLLEIAIAQIFYVDIFIDPVA